MNYRKLVSLAAAAVLGSSLLAASAQADDPIVLRWNNWLPPNHSHLVGTLLPWFKEVEEATDGRVKIVPTDSSLGAPPRQFDLVVDGIVDVALGIVGYTPGRFKVAHIADLPLVSESGAARAVAMWRVYQKYLLEVGEFDDVVLMSVYAATPGSIMTRDKPVTSVADMDGLKLRTGGGMMEDVSQALGAVNVSAPAGQLYELVSSGVADGAFMGGEGYDSFGLKGLINYVTLVPGGLYASGWYIIMNKDSWARISPEDQAAIMAVSGEKLAILAGSQFDAAEAAGREHMKADGVQITEADDAFMQEIRDRTKFLEDEWLSAAADAGVDGPAALEMFKKEAKDYEMAN